MKIFRAAIMVIAVLVFAVSAYKLYETLSAYAEGKKLYEGMAGQYVTAAGPKAAASAAPAQSAVPQPVESAPVTVDFAALLAQNPDVIGWIYCADTPINYPIVQSADNEDYLYRLLDGSYNTSGTLLADCRGAGDWSDRNTIIYGHNMKNGAMFGTLDLYRDAGYYSQHPCMWLLTPEQNYKIELIAGVNVSAESDSFLLYNEDEAAFADYLARMTAQSTFAAKAEAEGVRQVITLSTCVYEYELARYVLIGKLTPCA